MKKPCSLSSFTFLNHTIIILSLLLLLLLQTSNGQLSSSETRILLQVRKHLEYPQLLQNWSSNWTDFCSLPPSTSLKISCSNNHVTEVTILGNKTSTVHMSKHFSIDALFTDLTKLSKLKVLSLVSLGLWGPLPSKINRLSSLETLNLSSNSISGIIPSSISTIYSLKSLVLAQNLFKGSVPNLEGLTALEELDLSGNFLGPRFPSLGKSLVIIALRNNSFRSEISSLLIKSFNKLDQFDISHNSFIGPITSSLFSLPSIQYLNLAYNQFTGAVSVNTTCNRQLKFVDISHNLLIGKLPSCIGSSSSNRAVNTSWNCLSYGDPKIQHTNSFCHKEAMAVKPAGTSSSEKAIEPSKKLGLMLGIIGGIVGLCGIVLLLILVIVRRRRIREHAEDKFDQYGAEKTSVRGSPLPNIEPRRVAQRMTNSALNLPPYRVFTLEEIEEATNNFDPSSLIKGGGAQEQLYKGRLSDNSLVLVRCIKLKQKHMPQALTQQMHQVLQDLRHRHLVSVLGHCIVTYQEHANYAGTTVFVATEHVSNSSLRDYLTDWRRKEMLKWPQRLAISINTARGVQFLHMGITPGIFGNKLKVENVELDTTLTAKISNYKIPFPFKMESENPSDQGQDVAGRKEDEEKEDIYEFGVILLQVITGKLITSASEVDELKHQVEKAITEGATKLRGIVDPNIQGSFAYDSLKTTVQITMNCLCTDSSKRPSIEDVLWNLQYSMQVQEGWTSSGNLSAQM